MAETPATLMTQVEHSPLFRRIAQSDDLDAPCVLCCFRRESGAARAWFRDQTGREPERLFVMDGRVHRWAPLPGAFETSLQLVVFGARLRAKGTRLAARGHGQFLYATDPKLSSTRTAPDYLDRYCDRLERLWHSLADVESRLVLASILRQRVTGDCGYLRVSRFPEYFHPQVCAEPGETVVDAGAFNGATSIAFARRVGLRGKVYGFEPSRDNRRLIRQRLLKPWNWLLPVQVVPCALSDEVGVGQFQESRGGSGTLAEVEGSVSIELTTSINSQVAAKRSTSSASTSKVPSRECWLVPSG